MTRRREQTSGSVLFWKRLAKLTSPEHAKAVRTLFLASSRQAGIYDRLRLYPQEIPLLEEQYRAALERGDQVQANRYARMIEHRHDYIASNPVPDLEGVEEFRSLFEGETGA